MSAALAETDPMPDHELRAMAALVHHPELLRFAAGRETFKRIRHPALRRVVNTLTSNEQQPKERNQRCESE